MTSNPVSFPALFNRLAPLIGLALGGTASASPPAYRLHLDEGQPFRAGFELLLPDDRATDVTLLGKPGTGAGFADGPRCDRGRAVPAGEQRWTVPPECRVVSWAVRLDDHDRSGVDAAFPVGAWSPSGRWWLITERLPWIVPAGAGRGGELRMEARFAGGRRDIRSVALPGPDHPPYYGLVAAGPGARHRRDELEVRMHGPAPDRADADLAALAEIWAGWRRDVIPSDLDAPRRLTILWVRPPPDAEPGFAASAGHDMILMQSAAAADAPEPDARIAAAPILIGGHEGFHALLGTLPQTWPGWVNESWASFFAFRAAREHLDSRALAAAAELVAQPSEPGLLAAADAYRAGDGAQLQTFYAKGARFWAAIEDVLVTRDSPSGRLAALIRDSRGFEGVDWSSPASLAAFLDAGSAGKASAIVDCYLVEPGCA